MTAEARAAQSPHVAGVVARRDSGRPVPPRAWRAPRPAPRPAPRLLVVRLAEPLRRVGRARRLLVKELGAFGVVGALAFVVDVGLFQVFYDVVGLGAVTSKLTATLVSMTVAYVGHRYWSFSHRSRPGVGREYLRFVLINGATLLLGIAVVAFVRYGLGQESTLVLQVANVSSIVVGTLIRYLSYRRWVFPAHAHAPAADDEVRDEESASPVGSP